VKRKFERRVGSPILANETLDSHLQAALADVCLQYYTACPVQYRIQSEVQAGQTTVSVSDTMDDLFSETERWYYIGLIRTEFTVAGEGVDSNYEALLAGAGGVNVSMSNFNNIYGPYGEGLGGVSLWEPTAALQQASVRDQVIADLEVDYNEIDQEIKYLAPTAGLVTSTFGFGYYGDDDDDGVNAWDAVPMMHLNTVSMLTAEEMITLILTGRASVRLQNAGGELDTAALDQIRGELHEENREALDQISTPVTFFG